MTYNYKYKMEWIGHKYQTYKLQNTADNIYYRLEFYKNEPYAYTYDVISLKASNTPFLLTYNSKSDYVFEAFRPSSAEINIKLGSNSTVRPEDFYTGINNTTWKVVFKLINDTDSTEVELWSGFILSSDIQYEWQDEYYFRLTATDNIGILKEYVYTDSSQFSIPTSQDIYEGISIKDFIVRCLGFIGLDIKVKFAMNFKENMVSVNEASMFINEYACIDWTKKYPFTIETLLNDLLTTLGCICYLDNRDNTWTILSINELGTSTNNVVPYRLYSSAGTYESAGDYNIKTDIARKTDTVWSDTNQVVTLRPPLSSVRMICDYRPKNILPNYGFFQHSGTTPLIWTGAGTIGTDEPTRRNPYDIYMLSWNVNEDKKGPFDGSTNEKITIDMKRFAACYDAYTATHLDLLQSFAINIKFDYKIVGGVAGDGFNISPIFYRPNDNKYLSFDKNGDWNTTYFAALSNSNPIRIDVYSDNDSWNTFQALSKYTASDGTGSASATNWFFQLDDILFWIRPLRVTFPASGTPYLLIDNIEINLVPTGLLRTKAIHFVAYYFERFFQNNNPKIIKSMFHTGYLNKNDAFVFEDIIFVKDNIEGTNYIRSSDKWERAWENGVNAETQYSYLNSKTCSSIFSFYRASGRRFTGNVYAEQTPISEVVNVPFGFPVYCGIDNSQNVNVNVDLQTAFGIRVLADSGIVEDTLCGSDFLAEFNQISSNFLSTKATFDYFTNKTFVTLEEDMTSTYEDWESERGGQEAAPSSLFGNVGSTTGNTQFNVVDPA